MAIYTSLLRPYVAHVNASATPIMPLSAEARAALTRDCVGDSADALLSANVILLDSRGKVSATISAARFAIWSNVATRASMYNPDRIATRERLDAVKRESAFGKGERKLHGDKREDAASVASATVKAFGLPGSAPAKAPKAPKRQTSTKLTHVDAPAIDLPSVDEVSLESLMADGTVTPSA